MKTLYEYAVVRFMPFAETQEFANVGIVLWSGSPNIVFTKLAPAPFARINGFFDDLDGNLYKKARHFMELELSRIKSFAASTEEKQFDAIMHELTRQREGVMTFSEPGALLAEDPETVLKKLYDTYIGRDLPMSKEQRERVMVKELRARLNRLPLRYREKSLDTGFGQIKVPLVTEIGASLRAIKPMAFNQAKPIDIADHGDKWISRIRHVIEAKALAPNNFLFTVEPPKSKSDDVLTAFELVYKGMMNLGVQVIPYSDTEHIIEFAQPELSEAPVDFKLV